ncbi:MAG TPA: sulfotransferase [Stellaceae bacterium]|nr:sulfotransferase [Stellaceae bacterium]
MLGLPADAADTGRLPSHPAEPLAGKRLVFLIGAPRSGTTWLQLLLSRSPRIATANETHLFNGYLSSLFSTWDLHRRNIRALGLHHLLSECEYFQFIRDFATTVMLRIAAQKPDADILLEKTPGHVLHWQDIIRIFPDAAFLHIVRDPRSVVASLCAAADGWGAQWTSREALINCETWIEYIRASRSLSAATDNFLQVGYRDLWENGPQTLRSVFAWLGVEIGIEECGAMLDQCRIGNLRAHRLPDAPWDLAAEPAEFYRAGGTETWRSELTAREIYLVEHLTRELMRELGFAAGARRKIILPLIVASRLRHAIAWRRNARKAKTDAARH